MTRKLICSISFMLLFWYAQMGFASLEEDRNKYFCERNDIDMEKAKKFLDQFNDLVQRSDKKAIARMVHYPLKINKSKKSGEIFYYYINNEREFIEQYNSLIKADKKKSLEEYRTVDCDPIGYLSTAGGNFYFYYDAEKTKIAIINY